MRSSYTFTPESAVFDEKNLVSAAGLVPVLELAEQTGLSRLIDEHVELPSSRVKSALNSYSWHEVQSDAPVGGYCRVGAYDSRFVDQEWSTEECRSTG
ncbi:MAG TPA: hypothetical protein VLZ05_15310 [Mycobacterium sp.]|nr:hypothetical protein [Mycobacterium sp.]HUH70099.1 hypothetical protein [Mycobacterium sp.]